MKKVWNETTTNSVLNFNLDYSGKCESINYFDVDDVDVMDEILFEEIDKFVSVLKEKVKEFVVSPHRTIVDVSWTETGMNIDLEYYNSPDWNDYDTISLNELENIPFEWWGQDIDEK